jgi:hypothetical protein
MPSSRLTAGERVGARTPEEPGRRPSVEDDRRHAARANWTSIAIRLERLPFADRRGKPKPFMIGRIEQRGKPGPLFRAMR